MAAAATGPVNVITIAHFMSGLGEAILDTYRRVVPLVHQEPGCELFAVHVDEDQNTIVIIERWSTPEEHLAHKEGPLTRRLKDLHTGLHAGRNRVYFVEPTNIGDPHKGAIRPA